MKPHPRRVHHKTLEQPPGMLGAPKPPRKNVVAGRDSPAGAGVNAGEAPGEVLKKSLQLQKRLRQLTHRVLVAQENEREKISHELHDEIAQTLLGINVRLSLLKQAARSKAAGLKNEIASAQRLVVKSAALVRRLARGLDHHRPAPSELTVTAR